MKKFAYALMAATATLLGFGSVAAASTDYPPGSTPTTTLDPTDIELPATGSGGVSGLVFVALILLAVGVGLFVTAQARRRSGTSA